MKIRPRNIPKYQLGNPIIGQGIDPNEWTRYLGLYNKVYKEDARILGNTPLKQRTDFWKGGQGYDTHHLKDNLESAAWSNYNYTLNSNKSNIGSDIQYYANNSGKTYQDGADFVKQYNDNIDYIFNTQNKRYDYNMNDTSWSDFNDNYDLTYHSKGRGNSPATILYDESNKQYRGTSTHARRPDWYETPFDDLSDSEKQNRIHVVTINGKQYNVAKEQNGHLRLLPDQSQNTPPSASLGVDPLKPNVPDKIELSDGLKDKLSSVDAKDYQGKTKFNWDGIIGGLQQLGPNLLEDLRLGLSLNANQRIYDASLKGIRPNLMQTYLTHRQVVGDEATKQAYYRRAAAGQTKAAQPFTSDADRQMAYQMEAKRIGDELRAQGDLADNAEIRRTSDESNQHQWANTQRRTEVANLNVAQINAANQAKQNLLAQKYAADHSSWDNFLKGREYRWRQRNAENQAYQRQLLALQSQYD